MVALVLAVIPDWVFVVGVIAVVAGVGGTIWWLDHARRRSIFTLLRAQGFEVQDKSAPLNLDEHAHILGNPLLLYASAKVRWSAIGSHNGNYIRLLEYKYTTGSGKSTQTHVYLIATTDLPLDVPEFTLERKRWFMGHRPTAKGAPLPVTNPDLTQDFTCYAANTAGVVAMITPDVAAIIKLWDKSRWLRFGDGTLALGVRKSPFAKDVRSAVAELDRIFQAILAGAGVTM